MAFEDYKFTVRMPTGSISSSDKDSEWDQYIVSGTGNGAYSAGSNETWNWNTVYSWTSTSHSTSSRRVLRGGATASTWGDGLTSDVGTNKAFRPVLEIESLEPPFILLNKSLVYSGGSYQKWQPAEIQEGDMVKDTTYSEEGSLLRYNLHKQLTHVEVE